MFNETRMIQTGFAAFAFSLAAILAQPHIAPHEEGVWVGPIEAMTVAPTIGQGPALTIAVETGVTLGRRG